MAGLTLGFWAEAAITMVHLINRSPSAPLDNQIQEELWIGKTPHYAHLHVFGCEAYAHVPKELMQKLAPKSQKCIFIGYGTEGEMGYRLWNPESHKVIRSSHVIFNESKMHKKPIKEIEFRKVTFEDIPTKTKNSIIVPSADDAPQEQAKSSSQALRRSARVSHPPDRYVPSLNYVLLTDSGEPSCYAEAMQMDDCVKWEQAMQSEYDSIVGNDTWDLVELPEGKKPLPCKWVYKKKFTSNDPAPKYKARLVAKGFKQQHGVDFDEIFSPVVKMTTLRTVLGLVAIEDMELVQMDVKIAFLHGDLEEDVYMAQPEGYEQPGREKLVCKLNKALYGLKQGSRQWYQKFDTFMRSQEFKRSQEDYCLYTKKLSDGSQIILILYVDDMLIAGKSKSEIANLKQILSSQFAMKDLGEANHFLGMRIKRNRKKGILELSQESYIKKVLQRFNMIEGKSVSTPLPSYMKLSKEDSPKSNFENSKITKLPYS